ncbi:hypothetical protein ElyMa_006060700 [Elysia marginata]|uniref:Uncharacterized protein n=1 Tax=Elysia marginata TaxID=1093978 RepID=A0AAV4GNR3_9GAST|nr:hypothetical protein ElyMa_006060700 [Elysia marginata]
MVLQRVSCHHFLLSLMAMTTVMLMIKTTGVGAAEYVDLPAQTELGHPGTPSNRGYPEAMSELWKMVRNNAGQPRDNNQDKEDTLKSSNYKCGKAKLASKSRQRNMLLQSHLRSRGGKPSTIFEKFLKPEKTAESPSSNYDQYSYNSNNNRDFKNFINWKANGGSGGEQVLHYGGSGGAGNGKDPAVGSMCEAGPEDTKVTKVSRSKRLRDVEDDFQRTLTILEERRRAMEIRKLLEQLVQYRIISPEKVPSRYFS